MSLSVCGLIFSRVGANTLRMPCYIPGLYSRLTCTTSRARDISLGDMSVPTRFACEVPLQTTGFCFGASNYAGHNLTVYDRCAGQSYALTRDNAR